MRIGELSNVEIPVTQNALVFGERLLFLIVFAWSLRDGSACVSLRRVPKPGGAPGELQDDWLEYNQTDFTIFPEKHAQVGTVEPL